MFKFRNKKEMMGVILGAICFVPAFIIIFYISMTNFLLGMITLIITQYLWLTSINLCCQCLEQENKKLKQKIQELENK